MKRRGDLRLLKRKLGRIKNSVWLWNMSSREMRRSKGSLSSVDALLIWVRSQWFQWRIYKGFRLKIKKKIWRFKDWMNYAANLILIVSKTRFQQELPSALTKLKPPHLIFKIKSKPTLHTCPKWLPITKRALPANNSMSKLWPWIVTKCTCLILNNEISRHCDAKWLKWSKCVKT